MNSLHCGDIIGFRDCTPLALLIRCCTSFGPIHHVGILIKESGKLYLSHSHKRFPYPGVQISPISTIRSCLFYRLIDPLTPAESTALTVFAMSHLHRPYDPRGAIQARHTLLATLLRRPENLDKFFCSEWVAACLREIGRFNTDNASAWSPNKLIKELRRTKCIA